MTFTTSAMNKLLALITATALTALTATAATYHLAPDGKDTNAGTETEPFFTLNRAISVVVPGDTILLRGGTYLYTDTQVIAKPGKPDAPIKVLARLGERPVLNYTNLPAGSGKRGIMIERGADHWQFKGLEICYAGDNAVKVEASHLRFEQCVFHHNGDTGLQIGLAHTTENPGGELAAYIEVINCDSYRNCDYQAARYGNSADGFAAKLHCGKGIVFSGCRAWENADDGWDFFETDHGIVISNCWTWHNGDKALFPGETEFRGNGNGFKLGGNNNHDASIQSRGVHSVFNSIAFNNRYTKGGSGFTQNNHKDGVVIVNCLSYSNSPTAYDYRFRDPMNPGRQNFFTNNVSLLPPGHRAGFAGDTNSVAHNNSWDLGLTVTPADYNDLSEAAAAAPRPSDGSLPAGFARLVSGSPLLSKGVNAGAPSAIAPLGPYEVAQAK